MADPVRENEVVPVGVQQLARPEEHAPERFVQKGAAAAAGAVQDEHRVAHHAGRVAGRAAQRGVMQPELGQGLAGGEAEIADDEIPFRVGKAGPGLRRATGHAPILSVIRAEPPLPALSARMGGEGRVRVSVHAIREN